jgi:hypothetical protein
MPNWKKVITSGSDAAFNSVIASNGFTGSLQGTAATASYYQETDPIFVAKSASLATTGSNDFNGNQTITGSLSQGLAGNIASGPGSHAEGSATLASGEYSHAEGDFTQAIGNYSHAEGQNAMTLASAQYSHAEGNHTIAAANHQHVQGQWNVTSSIPAAFIVGNGTDDGNRSNLIYAHDSIVEITGSLNVSGGITGSLFGTGSWARNAVTASYITGSIFTSNNPALSASFALTASHALNVSPPVTINNNTDNFIVTATGTSATVQGEPNLRFDGSVLTLTGSMLISGSDVDLTVSGTVAAFGGGFVGNLTGTSSVSEVARRVRVGVLGNLISPPDDDYYVLMMRESLVGGIETSVLTTTSSMIYSASLGLLYVTASWAYTASQAISASWAANAVQTSPQGNTNEIQYNVDGVNFGGVSTLTYDGTTITATDIVATGRFDGNLRLGLFRGTRTTIPAPASKGDEVLVYTQQIIAGTFANDDVIRVHYRIDQTTNDTATYRIYLADTSDFSTVSGSLTNLIANVTASSDVRYVGIKRDLSYDGSKLRFMNSGSASTTDDITSTSLVSEFTADLTSTEYYMFFSAIPGQTAHTSKALSYSIERV